MVPFNGINDRRCRSTNILLSLDMCCQTAVLSLKTYAPYCGRFVRQFLKNRTLRTVLAVFKYFRHGDELKTN